MVKEDAKIKEEMGKGFKPFTFDLFPLPNRHLSIFVC
ncbi:hypothetical protein NIES3275_11480 [Microchaete diplosiphon NIES-3275]|nr:hypothetical protein NIES3275_11480 [Microchaete diplosiphon NIES-3275]